MSYYKNPKSAQKTADKLVANPVTDSGSATESVSALNQASNPSPKTASNSSAQKQAQDAKLDNAHGNAPERPGPSQAQNPTAKSAGEGARASNAAQSQSSNSQSVNGPSQISSVIGAYEILPGESAQRYHHGLAATIEELGAKSMMQIYAAEKIFQCLWWMRRYETQKRSTIIKVMTRELAGNSFSANTEKSMGITKLLESGQWNDTLIQQLMKAKGHTAGSLLEHAMDRQKQELIELDQSIALRANTLLQLQKSYEALVNRSVLQERLKLQNDLLKRDLLSIDVPVIKDVKLRGPKPQDDAKEQFIEG